MRLGLFIALLAVIFSTIYDISVRLVLVNYEVQPLVFVSFTNLFAALLLLTVSGRGNLGIDTIRQFHTWAYSFVAIFLAIIFMASLAYISATEANLLIRLSIVLSALMCWWLLGRPIKLNQLIGYGAILAGCLFIAYRIEPNIKIMALFLIGIVVLCQTLRTIIAETHPSSNKAENIYDNFRVTGYVLLITSFVFLFIGLVMAFVKDNSVAHDGWEGIFAAMPSLADYTDPATLLCATLLGLFIVAAQNFFYFQSTKKVGAETFLMVYALLPIFTFGAEWTVAQYGLLSITSIDSYDLYAGALITAGALWGIMLKFRGEKKHISAKQRTFMEQAVEHAHAAMVHFDNCEKQSAKALGVAPTTLKSILEGEKVFSEGTYKKVKAGFDKNVISRDPVTGLQNRLSYLTKLNKRMKTAGTGVLFLIDLNKFKPINDTYGHATGDAVLKAIAERLQDAYSFEAEITRLGGDEFSLFFYKFTEKPKDMKKHIETIIKEPIEVIGIADVLQVTGSVGFANFPDDGESAEELLKVADESMYKQKSR